MASTGVKKSDGPGPGPRPLHTSRSFSRIEPSSPKAFTRANRASTLQDGKSRTSSSPEKSNLEAVKESLGNQSTVYDHGSDEEEEDDDEEEEEDEETNAETKDSRKLPTDFDELPIELVSLTDR